MIRFMPNLESLLWSRKSERHFDCMEDLIQFIAEEITRASYFIGKGTLIRPDDVELGDPNGFHLVSGLKNCQSIIIKGRLIGHCGE